MMHCVTGNVLSCCHNILCSLVAMVVVTEPSTRIFHCMPHLVHATMSLAISAARSDGHSPVKGYDPVPHCEGRLPSLSPSIRLVLPLGPPSYRPPTLHVLSQPKLYHNAPFTPRTLSLIKWDKINENENCLQRKKLLLGSRLLL